MLGFKKWEKTTALMTKKSSSNLRKISHSSSFAKKV